MTSNERVITAAYKNDHSVSLRPLIQRPLTPNEIRLRVDACGICGSDLLTSPGEKAESPFGHEIAGTIIELGSKVDKLEDGQTVVLESSSACGRCSNCRNDRQELCTDVQSFFMSNSFGFSEEMIAPAVSAIPYDGLKPEIASLSEPLGVAIDMVRLADIRLDSNVLILGLGPIGLMALALVKRMGARRVFLSACSSKTARIEVARKFGVDEVVDPSVTPLPTYDFGCKIDRILVTTPPPTLNDAFQVGSNGAIISFIGIAYGDKAYCTFDVNSFHFKKLQLRSSYASPALFTPLALQYLREGVIDGEAMISHRFPLTKIEEAVRVARDTTRSVKVVVI